MKPSTHALLKAFKRMRLVLTHPDKDLIERLCNKYSALFWDGTCYTRKIMTDDCSKRITPSYVFAFVKTLRKTEPEKSLEQFMGNYCYEKDKSERLVPT